MYIHQQQDINCKIREFIERCQTEIVIRFKKIILKHQFDQLSEYKDGNTYCLLLHLELKLVGLACTL